MTSAVPSLILGTLSTLAAGYIVYGALLCRLFWPRTAGYAPYFRIIVAGLLLAFSVAAGNRWLASIGCLHLPGEYLPGAVFLLAIALRTIASGSVLLVSRLKPHWRYKLDLHNLNEKGLDQLVREKIYNEEIIMVTLKNRKVYMGWPFEAPNYDEGKWLRLVPLLSGYRDEKGEVRVTVDYSKVFTEGPSERAHMLLAVDSIDTVQPFDIDVHERFAGD